uniref:Uncharacterized protein n=1 Tax=Oryza meridionalis TaxID=40149 RepID=A0A0E0E7Q2_9ORYZ
MLKHSSYTPIPGGPGKRNGGELNVHVSVVAVGWIQKLGCGVFLRQVPSCFSGKGRGEERGRDS